MSGMEQPRSREHMLATAIEDAAPGVLVACLDSSPAPSAHPASAGLLTFSDLCRIARAANVSPAILVARAET